MKKIFKFVFYSLFLLSILNNFAYSIENINKFPHIIYLKGSCSSGKSTLIRSIQDQWKEIEVVDEDAIMQQTYVVAVAERFPCEFASIERVIAQENLYHAIREKDVFYKITSSEEERKHALDTLCVIQEELNKSANGSWKQEVSQSIDHQVIQQIKHAIEKGKIVLLDSWYVKPKHLKQHFPEAKVSKVLLYCSLKNTYEQFIKRNELAIIQENFSEKRYVRQLIGSFMSLYEISIQPEHTIEQIDTQQFHQILSSIASSLNDGPGVYQKHIFTFEEISKPYFLKLQNEFFFPVKGADNIETAFYIRPKENYNIILNSTNNNEELMDSLKVAIEQL